MWVYTGNQRFIRKHGEEAFVSRYFKATIGYTLNLSDPQTFWEKLSWMKVHVRDPLMTQCVDRWAVRDYVRSAVGEQYLVPMIGMYRKVDDIPFVDLPPQFVLKPNHKSGGVIICRDKSTLNVRKCKRSLRASLRCNAYYWGCEWAYKDASRGVVCEELLTDGSFRTPHDYKIHCFNGEPRFLQVDTDRFGDHRRNFYDTSWNLLSLKVQYENTTEALQVPEQFGRMLQIARDLAKPFPFVRVDLYAFSESVYLGELTFYPFGAATPMPEEYDRMYGDMLRLPGR